jgi:hypothetical protein
MVQHFCRHELQFILLNVFSRVLIYSQYLGDVSAIHICLYTSAPCVGADMLHIK